MSLTAALSLGGLVLMCLGFFLQLGAGLFHLGRHAQRIAALEERTKDSSAADAAIAVLAAAVGGLKEQVGEIRQDVKALLTGRVRPVSTGRTERD